MRQWADAEGVQSALPEALGVVDAPRDDGRPQNHLWPDREIARIAAAQAANVGHAQLRALGIPSSSITTALARGRLHPVHHGVHSLAPPEMRPPLADEHAALLACGPRAVLSHETAARLHGLELPGPPGDVHVTIVGSHRSRGRPRLNVHSTARLTRREWMRRDGLPVTTIPRTLLDLAPHRSGRALERLVDQALRNTSLRRLREEVERHPGRPGTPVLRSLLVPDRPSGDTWSRREEQLLVMLRAAGLPSPEANVRLGPYRPDLLWRAQRVIVEYQSREFHHSAHKLAADQRRANDLSSWGYVVLSVTIADLRVPARVLVWITAALTRAGWAGGTR